MNSEKYIGLDVHQATICVAVMDAKGKVVMESILETKATTILEFLAGLRGTLSATGSAATLAPASPARTAGGESQAYHHCQTAADPLPGAASLCFGGGCDPDPASVSHQATTLEL